MKHLIIMRAALSRRGSAPLWTLFIAILLISFSVLVFSGITLQTNFRQAQDELERAANIALDANLKNEAVRDIQLQVPLDLAKASFEENLVSMGYNRDSTGSWVRQINNRIIYQLNNLQLEQQGEQMILTGDLILSFLWGPETVLSLPIKTSVHTLFIDLN